MKRLFVAVVVALVATGALIWTKRQEFLVHAAVRGDAGIVRALVTLGADPNSVVTGSTPLYAAVWHHRPQAAECLIAAGADVNSIEPSGVTPLIAAASRGDDALVRLLLAHGADVHFRASCGTSLEVARANRHPTTEAILAAAGGSSN